MISRMIILRWPRIKRSRPKPRPLPNPIPNGNALSLCEWNMLFTIYIRYIAILRPMILGCQAFVCFRSRNASQRIELAQELADEVPTRQSLATIFTVQRHQELGGSRRCDRR